MKVPLSLLYEFCDPGLPIEEVASALALSGTEVERVTRIGVDDPSTFVVGEVLSCEQHPDADRLKVCSVDTGAGEPAQIVCGAPNVAAGQLVAVALAGSSMPSGMKIKSAKLRGVESNGMLCAEDELGLGKSHEGILVLPEGSGPAGRPLAEVLPLGETVLELEITPNRPDCLGVYGVARELHAATGAPLAPAPWEEDLGSGGPVDGISIAVESEEICPRFTARVYELPDGQGATPQAVKSHLEAAGMRSVSPIVDITNFAMLVTGEPMHAFDLDRIEGSSLTVRAAGPDESVATLDGEKRTLQAGEPLIADAAGPTSIAGVMGGARSEVGAETRRVLLEAAVWNGPLINRTANRLVLRSEASGRFEKGLAPINADRAQAFASKLFRDFCGVSPLAGTIEVGRLPASVEVELSAAKVAALLGGEWPEARIREPLERLGFGVAGTGEPFTVTVPDDRLDVARDVDLIEEIARIDGLDESVPSLPAGGSGQLSTAQKLRRKVGDQLSAAGLYEIAGWNFADPAHFDRLRLPANDSRRAAVELLNPMSSEESLMRTLLLGSVLESAARNRARGAESIRLFEIGPVFLPADHPLADEPLRIGGFLAGPSSPPDWRDQSPPEVDVHAGRAVLERLFAGCGATWRLLPAGDPEPFLHPVRSGAVEIGGEICGWAGELHPETAGAYGLDSGFAFEFDFEALMAAAEGVNHFRPISPHPAVKQDLAVIVPSTVSAEAVVSAAAEAAGEELEGVSIFDVYDGEGVPDGAKSLGLRLTFRAADRTLTEEEASAGRAAVLKSLTAEFGAQSRG